MSASKQQDLNNNDTHFPLRRLASKLLSEEVTTFAHEIGIEKCWIQMLGVAPLGFALNDDGGGFDPRWHSGDWTDCLSTRMLQRPTAPLNNADHLQPARQILLDNSELISSDLLNVTAKVTNIEIRIPAAIQDDVRSCDVVFKVNETLLLISSALLRTFLTGRLEVL